MTEVLEDYLEASRTVKGASRIRRDSFAHKEEPMQHARPNRLRRAVAFAALAALLGVVSLTLSHCTMVGDKITGVGMTATAPTTCLKHCNDYFGLLYKLEQKRHDAENNVCQLIEDNNAKNDCLSAESARHSAAKTALGAAKIQCQNDCHHQGVGSAG
jgi:hypothetical protein